MLCGASFDRMFAERYRIIRSSRVDRGHGVSEADSADHIRYRPDIDGLRAVAVLAVVAFHAFPQYAAGGLVGVDVFFVISGFLISGIIYRGLSAGRFSYVEFYVRRTRRIFPALFTVLACCLAAGWWLLFDTEYKALGKHVAGGSAFISNFVLWGESGYFDSQARFKTLLHLWSLGIEEQFYLVWPLLLAACWRFAHRLLPLVCALLLASFAWNVLTVAETPRITFYWPHT
jgi:peptidoglycan/LPS O-acetylase OafA/YrhL